ncbi:uncharacterized protein YndB with AHSA1/START domain/DNA-binding transcriptional ArsR family regulator [Psychromicrobium silvestre]|uniref:Uncharacterized protein YndB with AHSA1/START domain/DNA-binding transcriptional ArsR family regulator n=1 Tax=Psychromicrobium silvestre TaxID=1645614 RepID=A0A7Y9S589_9MICC|nr:metalloregulator ArsR/SmtB family transcription factor [Psychromicrobium silvestre]NYE93906.1 uncharacterized protein YndB with AHSA1/START domain/DNA-binding transcriptional ArsR family regulator [Psychromicrobium silvestre]
MNEPGNAFDDVFRALSDPHRRFLLDSLNQENGQTLRELCAGLSMTRQSVSKHLAILETANLVATVQRGREKLHFLNAEPINAIADRWITRYDRRRVEVLADLKTALEQPAMSTSPEFLYVTYIKTTAEQLWQALTEPAFTKQYWHVALISDWKTGSTITWEVAGISIADPEQTILISEPPHRLSYTWHTVTPEFIDAVGGGSEDFIAMGSEDRSVVGFELETLGELVKLTVKQTGFKDGSAILAGISQGWPSILASLKSLLETGEALSFE